MHETHVTHTEHVSCLACVSIILSAFILTSCGTTIEPTPSVDLRTAVGGVVAARNGNRDVRGVIASAQQSLSRASTTNTATIALARQMEREASPHAASLAKLTDDYSTYISMLKHALFEADATLQTQEKALQATEQELAYALDASALSEKEKVALRKERDKWKTKYLKLTKYRWAVYTVLVVAVLSIVAKIKGVLF